MYKARTKIAENKRWHTTLVRTRVALGYFVLVAGLGLLLRWQMVDPIAGINFKYFLHAHSHVALLGWLYCAFFAALLYAFPPASGKARKSFTMQFMLTQLAILGMLFTFPVQGYALFSITFSTLHILLSYWFAWSFWKQVRQNAKCTKTHPVPIRFISISLLFLVLSSIGPWAMGPIMASGNIGTELYFSSIYFYLHFQYNGWFTFAVLGLFFWLLDNRGIKYNASLAQRICWLLTIGCVLTYSLSILWTKPAGIWYWVGGLGAVLQLAALLYFLKLLWEIRSELALTLKPWVSPLLLLAFVALCLKFGMQVASAFPAIAELAYRVRYFIIGYLHLSLIGFVSVFLFAFFIQQGHFRLTKMAKAGMLLFLLFFFLTELLLFLQGTFLWLQLPLVPDFNWLMFALSIGMPVGLGIFFFAQPSMSSIEKES